MFSFRLGDDNETLEPNMWNLKQIWTMNITTHYKCKVAFKSVIKNMVTIQNIEVISQQIYHVQGLYLKSLKK